jgi:hypothetical protein
MNDIITNLLGEHSQEKIRKCTLLRALRISQPGLAGRRKKQRAKKQVIQEINRVVDWIRELSIKTQCFIQYYVLHKLTHHADLESQERLKPSVFTSNCIYGFLQLISGQRITSREPQMPTNRAIIFEGYQAQFENPADCGVECLPGYSSCLAYLSKTMATCNENAVVETFRTRSEQYLLFIIIPDIRKLLKKKKKKKKKKR